MKKMLLFIGCTVFFTGCAVRGPSVTLPSVDLPSVSVDSPVRYDDGGYSRSGGKGCPPGLAKQGRC